MQAFVDLLASKSVNVSELISHIFPIEDAPKAYELISNKDSSPYLGILLKYAFDQDGKSLERKITFFTTPSKPETQQAVVGVLGAGMYSQAVFLPMLAKAENTRLHTIVSASGVSASEAARKYHFSHASSNESDVLDNQEINTVVVLTQHDLHARQVIQALQQGKHVYCEKPLALNQEDLTTIFEVLKTNSSTLTVGFNRRFSPLAQQMKAFITKTAQPMMMYYRVNAGPLPASHWLHDPRRGGGRLLGEGCHFIDFLTFLAGESPTAMDVQALPAFEGRPAENAVIHLHYPNGTIGTIAYMSNGDRSYPKEACEVFCGGKIAILDDFRRLTMVENGKKQVVRSRQNKGHRESWDAFVNGFLQGGAPSIPYEQLWSVSLAAILAQQTANSGDRIAIPPLV